jgi:hypothetical protein
MARQTSVMRLRAKVADLTATVENGNRELVLALQAHQRALADRDVYRNLYHEEVNRIIKVREILGPVG